MDTDSRFVSGRIAVILFLAALAFRFIYLFQIQPLPFTTHLSLDPAAYDERAREIVQGDWLGDRAFYQEPLYPYLLAVLYKFFGHHLNLVRTIQLFLGALNCILVFWMGLRLFGKKQAVCSGILTIFYGIFVFYDGAIGKDGLSVFLTDLALLALICCVGKPSVHRWFLSGIAMGSAVLTRGNLLLIIPFIMMWMAVVLKRQSLRTILVALMTFAAGLALPISPVTIRNYIVSRDFVLTTSQGGQNFYIGNNPRANGYFENPERVRLNPIYEESDFEAEALRKTGRASMKPSEISKYWFHEGVRFALDHPQRTLNLLIKKTVLFWNQFEIPDNYNYYFYKNEVVILQILFLGFGIIAPLGLIGLFLARKNPGTWLLGLFILGYMISIVPFHMASRYRLPVVPPLLLFAGYTMNWTVDRIRSRQFKPLLFTMVALIVLVLFVHWKVDDVSGTFKAPLTQLGIIAAEQQDDPKAIDYFEKALAIDPHYTPAQYNLGNVLAKNGRYREAAVAFKEALKSDPEFLLAYNNLGKTYIRLGLFDDALEMFNQALRIRPNSAEAQVGVGIVHHSTGRYDEAIEAYQRAISLEPLNAQAYYNMACAYGQKGDIQSAKASLQKAVDLKPEYRQEAQTDKDLEILKKPLSEDP